MDMADALMLGAMVVLGFATAVMRIRLGEKQNKPLRTFWKVQSFLFPVIILLALGLFLLGIDMLFPAVLIALAEELICGYFRRREEQKEPE